MSQKLFRLASATFVLALLAGCGPVTPYATPVLQDIQTSTSTPLPSATPTITFFNFPSDYVPSATPTFVPIGKITPDLEVISPENIGRLELINRWGKGRLLVSKTSPDHTIVAAATTTGVYLYRAQDLKQIGYLNVKPTDYQFMEIGFSPDSKLLAVAGDDVSLWDVALQTQVGVIPIEKPFHQPWSIKFTPDGRHIAIEEITYVCGGGGNFALYTIEGYKVFDATECGSSDAGMDGYFRIVNDRWFYFFNNSRDWDPNVFPNEVIKVDLTTDKIVDVIRNDALRKLYDISPDGKLAAYSIGTKTEENNSYTISYKTEILDIATGQIMGTLKGQVEFVKKDSGEITWQVITNNEKDEPTQPCNLDPYIKPIDIPNSEDKLILTNPIQVIDLSTCKVKSEQIFPMVYDALSDHSFDASGNKLVATGSESNSILDVKTGEFTYSSITYPNFIMLDLGAEVSSFSGFNTDGTRLITSRQKIGTGRSYTAYGYTLEAVDTATGQVMWSHIPDGSRLDQILPGADNSTILVEDNLGLHVWNLNSGEEERSILGAGAVYQTPNGQQYIFVANNIVHVWDVKNWKDLTTFDGGELGYVRKISPISKRGRIAILYTLGENPWKDWRIVVFDVHSGKKVFEISDDEIGLELIENQPYFVHKRNDGYIELWSTDQNTPINTFLENDVSNALRWNKSNVLLSLDTQIFITPNDKHEIEFWDVKSGMLLAKLSECTNPLFSPDGRMLVTVGDDGTFWVWGVKRQ